MRQLRATVILLLTSGCFDSDDAPGPWLETASETAGDEGASAWAEVKCVQNESGLDVYVARPVDASTWALVIPAGDAESWPARPSWGDSSCAPDDAPMTWAPGSQCNWLATHDSSACFIGDSEWIAFAQPECDVLGYYVDEWPESFCDGDAWTTESSPWDAIRCHAGGSCVGISGNSATFVFPGCMVDSMPECD